MVTSIIEYEHDVFNGKLSPWQKQDRQTVEKRRAGTSVLKVVLLFLWRAVMGWR